MQVWEHIKRLPVQSAYVAPAGFLETLFWPNFPQGTQDWDKGYVHKYVATDDIGHVAADFLAQPEKYAGREIMLAGDAVTRDEFRKVWKEVIGSDLEAVAPTIPFVKEMVKVRCSQQGRG